MCHGTILFISPSTSPIFCQENHSLGFRIFWLLKFKNNISWPTWPWEAESGRSQLSSWEYCDNWRKGQLKVWDWARGRACVSRRWLGAEDTDTLWRCFLFIEKERREGWTLRSPTCFPVCQLLIWTSYKRSSERVTKDENSKLCPPSSHGLHPAFFHAPVNTWKQQGKDHTHIGRVYL